MINPSEELRYRFWMCLGFVFGHVSTEHGRQHLIEKGVSPETLERLAKDLSEVANTAYYFAER